MPIRWRYALAIFLSSGMLLYYFGFFIPAVKTAHTARHLAFTYGEDLYPYWLGTRELMAERQSPYSAETTREIQQGIFGRTLDPATGDPLDRHGFAYPLYVVLYMLPFAWMPFPAVWWIALAGFGFLMVMSISWWGKALGVRLPGAVLVVFVFFVMSSYPVLEAMVAVQMSLLVFALMAAAAVCLARGRYSTAGILFAIGSIKPQLEFLPLLFLFLWVVSDWKRRRNLVISFGVSVALLLAASEFLMPGWVRIWRTLLGEYRVYTPPPMWEFVLGHALGIAVLVVVLACAAWLSLGARKESWQSPKVGAALVFTLAVTVVAFPMGNAIYDHIFLLPAVLWLYGRWRELALRNPARRLLFGLLVIDLLWPWIAAWIVVIWTWFRPPGALFFSLPLRTAGSLPFVVIAVLALVEMFGNRTLHRPSASAV